MTYTFYIYHIDKKEQKQCKYFSQTQILYNNLVISTLQNLLFGIPKA